MKVILGSCGKAQVLSGAVPADLYIDCRGMINPYRDPVLGGLNGDHALVQDWIREHNAPYVQGALSLIKTAIISAPTRGSFQRGGDEKVLKVMFFCLAGVHRSRGLKHVIAQRLKEENLGQVEVI